MNDSLRRLRSFGRHPEQKPRAECELCTAPLGPGHQHVVERVTGSVHCCCDACGLLFQNPAASRYRTVPRDARRLPDFQLSDAQWQSLAIPIGLAFLFESTRAGRVVAVYPSPAGGTEAEPLAEAWSDICRVNPCIVELAADVEALLVNRIDGARKYYRVPIDQCYQLVGLVRMRWRGFTGGTALWQEVGAFFANLEQRVGS